MEFESVKQAELSTKEATEVRDRMVEELLKSVNDRNEMMDRIQKRMRIAMTICVAAYIGCLICLYFIINKL